MLVLGLDLAPTHSAAALLNMPVTPDGVAQLSSPIVLNSWFTSEGKQLVDRHPKRGVRLPNLNARKKMTDLAARMHQCDGLRRMLGMARRWVDGHEKTLHVVFEGYAVGARGMQLEAGEVGGVARQVVWNWRIPWKAREYHPRRVAEFLGFDTVVQKPAKLAEAIKRYPAVETQFARYRTGAANGGDTFGDLVDAYVLARMGIVELALRADYMRLGDLPDGPERQLWTKTTNKQQPVNLLAMEWTERA